MPDARLITLADLPADRPMPLIQRRRIIGEQMMVSQVHLAKGFTLASHHHPNEQFVVMLSGHCTFGIGNTGEPGYHELDVRAGQVLCLPGNVPHSCLAHEDTQILDLFSPVSETTGVDQKK